MKRYFTNHYLKLRIDLDKSDILHFLNFKNYTMNHDNKPQT